MKALQNVDANAIFRFWGGDLMEGVPQKVAFSLALSEGVYAESSVELFLYSGEGKPVATSLSRGLKELTNKQLERLIELEQRS